MGYYIHAVIVFVIGNTIRKAVVIGNYIHRVIGSLFSREYGMHNVDMMTLTCPHHWH